MSRISIYARNESVRDATSRLVEALDDVELIDIGDRAPRRLPEPQEGDVLVLGLDLPVADRLEILGQVWRTLRAPRILFLACDDDGGASGETCRIDDGDGERLVASIRELFDGARDSARVGVRIRRAGPVAAGPGRLRPVASSA